MRLNEETFNVDLLDALQSGLDLWNLKVLTIKGFGTFDYINLVTGC
jgi:hypothetical protein